jgi:hypothetical protein
MPAAHFHKQLRVVLLAPRSVQMPLCVRARLNQDRDWQDLTIPTSRSKEGNLELRLPFVHAIHQNHLKTQRSNRFQEGDGYFLRLRFQSLVCLCVESSSYRFARSQDS